MIRPRRLGAMVVSLAVGAAMAGCGDGGAARSGTARVKGTVTVNGQPLAVGGISFLPDKQRQTKGRAAMGKIVDGKVEKMKTYDDGDGAIVGWHKVTIRSAKPGGPVSSKPGAAPPKVIQRIPARYNTATELTFEVVAGKVNEFKFDLKIPGFK
jgi:hypothetical protein